MLRYNKNILKEDFFFNINIISNVNSEPIKSVGVFCVRSQDRERREKKNYLSIPELFVFQNLITFRIFLGSSSEREQYRMPSILKRVKKK